MNTHLFRGLESMSPVATLSATATTVAFWGLHISDVAVMLSALASVCGAGLQFYVTLKRLRKLEADAKPETKHAPGSPE
jgi:hypothetical protein